jgi:FixJ family two-component response regulator
MTEPIIVIDDDAIFLAFVAELLRRGGYAAKTFLSANEANQVPARGAGFSCDLGSFHAGG